MEHYSEQSLELYVLQDPAVKKDAMAIARHLAACPTCRRLVEEMQQFYDSTAENLVRQPEAEFPPSEALLLSSQTSSHFVERMKNGLAPLEPGTFRGRLWRLATVHPLAACFSFLGVAGAVVLGTLLATHTRFDTDPVEVAILPQEGALATYNTAHQKITSIPSYEILSHPISSDAEQEERELRSSSVIIASEDGSRHFVASTLTLGASYKGDRTLRLLDGNLNSVRTVPPPDSHISFRGVAYSTGFSGSILASLHSAQWPRESLVLEYGNGRSPCAVRRYDANGNLLGTFWHYGQVDPCNVGVNGDGKEEIALVGVNDVDDQKTMSRGILILLDPEKIADTTESSATRGFGVKPSQAELYYISFPCCDIGTIGHQPFRPYKAVRDGAGPLQVDIHADARLLYAAYSMCFDNDMRAVSVKLSTAFMRVHQQYTQKGKVSRPLDDAYLKDILDGIRYWNGTSWQKEPTKVLH